jgi:hypothetical protein
MLPGPTLAGALRAEQTIDVGSELHAGSMGGGATCSIVSQVSTPKMTGTPLSVDAPSTPLVAPPTTAS